jgi:hypothetical protein
MESPQIGVESDHDSDVDIREYVADEETHDQTNVQMLTVC